MPTLDPPPHGVSTIAPRPSTGSPERPRSGAPPMRCVGGQHSAARLYSRVRRGLVPRAERLLALAGRWEHEQLRAAGVRPEVTLWCPGADGRAPEHAADLEGAARSAYAVSERTLARLHPGLAPPALLSVVRLPDWRPAQVWRPDARLVLVADGIEYAGNLGTLIRTADAAGADGLVLTHATCRTTHPKVFGASRGTLLTLPVVEYADIGDARRDLAAAGFTAYVADPAATRSYLDTDYRHRKVAVVVGSEGNGVAPAWRTPDLTSVAIPMRGRADSLNVAVSASILLFDARARMSPAR